MPRAGGTFQNLAHAAGAHPDLRVPVGGCVESRIHFLNAGGKHSIDAETAQELGVGVEIAWVVAVVVAVAEVSKLQWVDENRCHHDVVVGTSGAHEAGVPVVQRAHRRHEAYRRGSAISRPSGSLAGS